MKTITKLDNGEVMVLAGHMLDGPKGHGLVPLQEDIEAHILALAAKHGDNPDEYTVTDMYVLQAKTA